MRRSDSAAPTASYGIYDPWNPAPEFFGLYRHSCRRGYNSLTLGQGGPLPLTSGSRIGHYEVTSKIGEGGMGECIGPGTRRLGDSILILHSATVPAEPST